MIRNNRANSTLNLTAKVIVLVIVILLLGVAFPKTIISANNSAKEQLNIDKFLPSKVINLIAADNPLTDQIKEDAYLFVNMFLGQSNSKGQFYTLPIFITEEPYLFGFTEVGAKKRFYITPSTSTLSISNFGKISTASYYYEPQIFDSDVDKNNVENLLNQKKLVVMSDIDELDTALFLSYATGIPYWVQVDPKSGQSEYDSYNKLKSSLDFTALFEKHVVTDLAILTTKNSKIYFTDYAGNVKLESISKFNTPELLFYVQGDYVVFFPIENRGVYLTDDKPAEIKRNGYLDDDMLENLKNEVNVIELEW